MPFNKVGIAAVNPPTIPIVPQILLIPGINNGATYAVVCNTVFPILLSKPSLSRKSHLLIGVPSTVSVSETLRTSFP